MANQFVTEKNSRMYKTGDLARMIPQSQKWSVWRHSRIGDFTTAVLLLDSKLCQLSPDMTNGEKALQSKTYRHLPRCEKIV